MLCLINHSLTNHPVYIRFNLIPITERFGNNPNDIRTIVDRHNFYRQAVVDGKVPGQPSGIDLKYLVIFLIKFVHLLVKKE